MHHTDRGRRFGGWTWATLTFCVSVFFGAPPSEASEAPIAIGEVSTLSVPSDVDIASIRDAAAAEVGLIDTAKLPARKRVVISLAVRPAVSEQIVACSVSATIRDARTGVMIAIIESGAHAEGPASMELQQQVTQAAVRRAVRRVPRALGGG
jgi:hypothetical protein